MNLNGMAMTGVGGLTEVDEGKARMNGRVARTEGRASTTGKSSKPCTANRGPATEQQTESFVSLNLITFEEKISRRKRKNRQGMQTIRCF